MKKVAKPFTMIAILFFAGHSLTAQTSTKNSQTSKSNEMKTYLIERNIPDAGKLTPEQLKGISQKSCSVLKNMGPDIQWIQSYVTADKIVCVYKARNEDLIRQHGAEGGFPVTSITEVGTIISPATAKE